MLNTMVVFFAKILQKNDISKCIDAEIKLLVNITTIQCFIYS